MVLSRVLLSISGCTNDLYITWQCAAALCVPAAVPPSLPPACPLLPIHHLINRVFVLSFSQFVAHCSTLTQDCPEVLTYLQGRHAKASSDYLSSVAFRNTLGSCLTRAQANRSKTFVYINELCTVLRQHSAKRRQLATQVHSVPCTSMPSSLPSTSSTWETKVKVEVHAGKNSLNPAADNKQPSKSEQQEDGKDRRENTEVEKTADRASRKQVGVECC